MGFWDTICTIRIREREREGKKGFRFCHSILIPQCGPADLFLKEKREKEGKEKSFFGILTVLEAPG